MSLLQQQSNFSKHIVYEQINSNAWKLLASRTDIVENHSENVQWIGGEPICSGVMCASFLLLEWNFKQNDFSNRISYTSIYKLNGEENFV